MVTLLPLVFLFDVSDTTEVENRSQILTDSSPEEEKIISCVTCKEMVTKVSEKTSVGGSHRHVFTNPHGYIFEIGCFNTASGCVEVGDSTSEFSWFSGYVWRYAVCHRCHSHLGWVFENGKGSFFYGLILKKLAFP